MDRKNIKKRIIWFGKAKEAIKALLSLKPLPKKAKPIIRKGKKRQVNL